MGIETTLTRFYLLVEEKSATKNKVISCIKHHISGLEALDGHLTLGGIDFERKWPHLQFLSLIVSKMDVKGQNRCLQGLT